MGKFFNMDSPMVRFMTKLADLMLVNVLFLITCVPVVTIGAGWTALYFVVMKLFRGEEGGIFRDYFRSFRQNFRQATILWLGVLALAALVLVDLRLITLMEASPAAAAVHTALLVLGAAVILVLQYLFPSLARFENPLGTTIKNAALMAVCHLPQSIVMAVFSGGLVYVTLLNGYTLSIGILVWMFLGFSLAAFCNSSILLKIFDRYTPGTDNGDSPARRDAHI